MRPLRNRLRAYGHDVHLVPELSALAVGDVRGHAEELDQAVQRVCRKTGVDRVHVVGTSQGGIIALWWAARLSGWARLDRLVALGTPFRGSPAARMGSRVIGRFSAGVHQLIPGSEVLETLASSPLQRPVISICMRGDPVCPPEACVLPGMRQVLLDARYGLLTHQLLMLDAGTAKATHEALTC